MRPGAGPAAEPPGQLTRITGARRPQRVRRNGGKRRAAPTSTRGPRLHSLSRSVRRTEGGFVNNSLTEYPCSGSQYFGAGKPIFSLKVGICQPQPLNQPKARLDLAKSVPDLAKTAPDLMK